MAVAQRRSWPFVSHRALQLAVLRLAEENNDAAVDSEFATAETFHENFFHQFNVFHQFMENHELRDDPAIVYRFVNRMLGRLA